LRNPSNGQQHISAPASTLKHLHRPFHWPGAPSLREATGELGKYQVVAGNITDAVTSLGGLIFDHAMAGWEVSMVVDGDADRAVDNRPIRILGGRLAKRMSDPGYAHALPYPHLLAVAADVMVKSDPIRRYVLALANDSGTDVLLWSRHHPSDFSRTLVAGRHQPSAAARIFKSHALLDTAPQAIPRADEAFYLMA
jgi:hypothetical protein